MSVSACELVDPTDVDNPNLTDEAFIATPRAIIPWMNGLERQMAITLNETVQFAELISDNYFNNRTLSSKVFDIPQIDFLIIDVADYAISVCPST
ncbi:MAG: hypothetical protein HC880_21700 [Bacteroidia bacterium]|nr:hypothetical protein [Bacteroidia bacterium]